MSESEHDPGGSASPVDPAAVAAVGDVLSAAWLVVAVWSNPDWRLSPEQREVAWEQTLGALAAAVGRLELADHGYALRCVAVLDELLDTLAAGPDSEPPAS